MNILERLRHRRIRHKLRRSPIPFALWRTVTQTIGVLQNLGAVEKARLRKLATLFIHDKTFTGAHDFRVTDEMAVAIAAQAALPILNLGMEYYDGWIEVIIYPDSFQVNHDNIDTSGIISEETHLLSGESWLRGPVILSWQDIERDMRPDFPGHNIVIHEFAHKLDMLNGRTNGMPPLHPRMKAWQWTKALGTAFDILQRQVEHHHRTRIDAYAATTPAEFFAVVSEYFFAAPSILCKHCPEVYQQLTQFYLQDPLIRCKCEHNRKRIQACQNTSPLP